MISCSRPSRSVTRSWTSPAPVTTGRLSSANGPGGTERASRCTLSMNTSTTESCRARPPMVGSGKVTKAGSVPKLVAYWMPAMRTGGARRRRWRWCRPAAAWCVTAEEVAGELVSSRVTLGSAGQVLEQEARQRGGAGVEPAELDQAAHALVQPAAGLVEQVVVEKAAGAGHRRQPLGRRRRGRGADEFGSAAPRAPGPARRDRA